MTQLELNSQFDRIVKEVASDQQGDLFKFCWRLVANGNPSDPGKNIDEDEIRRIVEHHVQEGFKKLAATEGFLEQFKK